MKPISPDQLKAGDELSYKKLFDEYYSRLCVFAKKYTNDIEASKDIVQDLFVKLYEDRKTIEFKSSINSYLYQAVRNRCLNYIKHNQINASHLADIEAEKLKESQNWKEKMLETELELEIHNQVSKLPDRCQKIFKMSRIENLRNKQIADKLNISVRTVETQIFKAIKKIRMGLTNYLTMVIIIPLFLNL